VACRGEQQKGFETPWVCDIPMYMCICMHGVCVCVCVCVCFYACGCMYAWVLRVRVKESPQLRFGYVFSTFEFTTAAAQTKREQRHRPTIMPDMHTCNTCGEQRAARQCFQLNLSALRTKPIPAGA
jgi:hypothetical protein